MVTEQEKRATGAMFTKNFILGLAGVVATLGGIVGYGAGFVHGLYQGTRAERQISFDKGYNEGLLDGRVAYISESDNNIGGTNELHLLHYNGSWSHFVENPMPSEYDAQGGLVRGADGDYIEADKARELEMDAVTLREMRGRRQIQDILHREGNKMTSNLVARAEADRRAIVDKYEAMGLEGGN